MRPVVSRSVYCLSLVSFKETEGARTIPESVETLKVEESPRMSKEGGREVRTEEWGEKRAEREGGGVRQ